PPDNSMFKDMSEPGDVPIPGPENFLVPLYYLLGIVSLALNSFTIYLVKRKSAFFSSEIEVVMMATTLMILSSFIILLFNREQALLKEDSTWRIRKSATPASHTYFISRGSDNFSPFNTFLSIFRSTTLTSKKKVRYTAKSRNAFIILLQFALYLGLVSLPILIIFVFCNREDSQTCQVAPEIAISCFSTINAIVFIIGNKQYKKILVKRLFNIAVVNVMNSVTDSV
ncbi:hypothetical protein PENTCL1PPCAC_7218, partial [Pristionchus entomophagus]